MIIQKSCVDIVSFANGLEKEPKAEALDSIKNLESKALALEPSLKLKLWTPKLLLIAQL